MLQAAKFAVRKTHGIGSNETQNLQGQFESSCVMRNQHRSMILASAVETLLATVVPMSLPLPDPLGKCPPRKAAEMTLSPAP
jgi:hypothetical protein